MVLIFQITCECCHTSSEGVRGATFIVAGNGNGEPSSNTIQGYLYFI